MPKKNGHGIRLPGSILDEIKANDGGDKSRKFGSRNNESRKDRRKRERKEKRGPSKKDLGRTESDDEWFGGEGDTGHVGVADTAYSEAEEEEAGGDDPLSKLKAMKEEKTKKQKEKITADPMAELKELKKRKREGLDDSESKSAKKKKEKVVAPPKDAGILKEEKEMAHYAKKLGLKNMKLTKGDDGLDDLLGDLDFDEVDSEAEDESLAEDDSGEFSYDDDEDDDGEQDDNDEGEEEEEEEEVQKPKENPYIAPVAAAATGKYIPPSRRAALAGASTSNESEEDIKLRKQIKGLLNRLSEANIGTIINELESLYGDNARHSVNHTLTNVVIESTAMQGMLQEQFLIVHAALVTALYRTVGVEFGAHFVQTLVERFETASQDEAAGKQASNLLSLISQIYIFEMISCRLIYDFIKSFLQNIDETRTGFLQKMILNVGPQLRSDDPAALKEIILMLQSVVRDQTLNTRTKFLVESITDLKNNRQKKQVSEVAVDSVRRMKKFLGSVLGRGSKSSDPLQVSLDDIRSVKTKGKWWLVGAAWNGAGKNPGANNQIEPHLQQQLDDVITSADTNWLELAKQQRMNTDIRRAIFVTIMSSEDYVDASDRLTKLNLKSKQEREIPKVVLHCVASEQVYNPFYALVASRLCATHSLKKTFQFQLWDYIGALEGEETEEQESNLQKTMHYARFFAYLVSESAMSLDLLKTVNFLTGASEVKIFVELLLVTLYQAVGKRAEVSSSSSGNRGFEIGKAMFETRRNDSLMTGVLQRTKDTKVVQGIQVFQRHADLVKSASASFGIKKKKPLQRIEWAVNIVSEYDV